MKKILLLVVLLLTACGQKEVVVNQPFNESISEIVETTQRETTQEETTKETELTLEEKEALFLDLIQTAGGDTQISCFENYNRIKEGRKRIEYIYDENGDFHSEETEISLEDYLDEIIGKLKKKYADIDERQGEDWEYVSNVLNMPDYGTYENAFHSLGDEFWSNSLSYGVFENQDEADKAYEEFMATKNMKEKAEYLKNLLSKKEQVISDAKPILEEYVNNIIKIIYGNDAGRIEVKELGYTSLDNNNVRFNYVIGEKIVSEQQDLYYIEDYLKGKIEDGKFIRDLNPTYTDEDEFTPEFIKDGMLMQYVGAPDGNYLNHVTSIEKYMIGETFGCEEYNILYSQNPDYIINIKSEFKNLDEAELKGNITSDLPICRKVKVVSFEKTDAEKGEALDSSVTSDDIDKIFGSVNSADNKKNAEEFYKKTGIKVTEPENATKVKYEVGASETLQITYLKEVKVGEQMIFIINVVNGGDSGKFYDDYVDDHGDMMHRNVPYTDGESGYFEAYHSKDNPRKMEATWGEGDAHYTLITETGTSFDHFIQEMKDYMEKNHNNLK